MTVNILLYSFKSIAFRNTGICQCMIKLLHHFTLLVLTSRCLLLLHRFPRPTSAKVKVKNGVDLHLESTLVSKSARNSWTLSLPTEARWPPWNLEELLLSKKKGYVVDNSNLIYHLQDFSPSHQDFFVLLSL